MHCDEVQRRLDQLLDERRWPVSNRDVASHVAECGPCAARLASYRLMAGLTTVRVAPGEQVQQGQGLRYSAVVAVAASLLIAWSVSRDWIAPTLPSSTEPVTSSLARLDPEAVWPQIAQLAGQSSDRVPAAAVEFAGRRLATLPLRLVQPVAADGFRPRAETLRSAVEWMQVLWEARSFRTAEPRGETGYRNLPDRQRVDRVC